MKGFFEGLQTAPIAEIAPGYGLEVIGPHVRRQEVDKRCLEALFLRFLVLVRCRYCCRRSSHALMLLLHALVAAAVAAVALLRPP
jgi:hypothetical protein